MKLLINVNKKAVTILLTAMYSLRVQLISVSAFQFWPGDDLYEAAVYLYDFSDMETGLFLP